jgi:hypothetical protein
MKCKPVKNKSTAPLEVEKSVNQSCSNTKISPQNDLIKIHDINIPVCYPSFEDTS